MESLLIVGILLLAVVLYFVFRRAKGPSGASLREEYLRELRVPRSEGEDILERQLSRLKDRHPGKPEEWYYEKMLYDLRRDRG